MTSPASHRSDRLNLPDISVSVIDPFGRTEPKRATLANSLINWQTDNESNLLLVMGDFGTGKTTALLDFASAPDSGAEYLNFDEIQRIDRESRNRPATKVVIFDNFDAINSLSGARTQEPDLTEVNHLAPQHRIILATRRSPQPRADELLGQITSEQRLAQLGFRKPTIIHLLPWDLHDLQNHAAQLQPKDPDFELVVSYLSTTQSTDADRLRRPLLIKMLFSLARKFGNLDGHLTLARLYHEYCSIALAADYDAQRSSISTSIKSDILADLAYDIFSGAIGSDDRMAPALSLPVERVSERVLEVLMRTSALRQHAGIDTHGWTEDFLSTNHIFERISATWLPTVTEPQYRFVHESFYEYFVSAALCRRIGAGRTLGLEISRFSPATVDSLAFAFAKELGGSQLRDAIRYIVQRPRLSVADRLVLLYFLEDEADFADMLSKTPAEYIIELTQLETSVPSFFLKKMIRYQLVVLGQYDPDRYIAELRKYEDEGGLQVEVRLHSTETGVTQRLLQRLRSSVLEKARPITIYRLGQLGDASAIEPLEWFASSARGKLKIASTQAIAAIRSRLGKQK